MSRTPRSKQWDFQSRTTWRGLLANERILLLGPSACERRASELFDDEVNRYLRLVSELGQVVYHFAIGYPIPDPRLEA